jgi:adenylate cyclase
MPADRDPSSSAPPDDPAMPAHAADADCDPSSSAPPDDPAMPAHAADADCDPPSPSPPVDPAGEAHAADADRDPPGPSPPVDPAGEAHAAGADLAPLLDGLEGEAREERRGLLEDLLATGIPVEELARASAEGMLPFLPAERAVGGAERYTFEEVAARSGLDPQLLLTLRRAQGLPSAERGERVFTDADVDIAKLALGALHMGVTEEEIVSLSRTLGRGLAQAAEHMRAIALRLVLEPGVGERELARRYAAASTALAPVATRLVGDLLNLHLRQMAQSEAITATERVVGHLPGARDVGVAFADLVGFTRMGEQVPADELGRLASDLEALTLDTIAPPVRLVKTIGDAVMLVSPDTDPLLDATLSLVEAADARGEQFPQVHAGVAHGAALSRAGDWFGQPVNLASRVTTIARPGSVLATAAVREVADGRFRFSNAGERKLKGVRGPQRLFRVRRAEPDGAPAAERRG